MPFDRDAPADNGWRAASPLAACDLPRPMLVSRSGAVVAWHPGNALTMKWLIGSALLIVVLALVTQLGASRAEQDFPPLGRFAEVGGLRLHYHAFGSGPALVMIHGASTNLGDFYASIAAPLKKRHRVIIVDRPGHGYSDRPRGAWPDPAAQARLIRGLLHQLSADAPILIGHSWSGSVVLAYLLDYPQEPAGGVLLAGGSHPWQGGVAWYNDLAGIPVIGKLFAHTLAFPFGTLALDVAVQQVLAPNPVPEAYVERTGVRLSLRPDTFLANAEDLRRLSDYLEVQSERYADIDTPLLLITGDADDIVPAWNHAERLVRQAGNTEHISLANTGHALHHARPDEVARLIEAFARRVAKPTGPRRP